MTRLGRKPQGAVLVDPLSGSEHAKARLKAFLATLSGELSVEEACLQLGICRRGSSSTQCLATRLDRTPGTAVPGRPRKEESPVSADEPKRRGNARKNSKPLGGGRGAGRADPHPAARRRTCCGVKKHDRTSLLPHQNRPR